jgi:hypothetical protein
MEFGAPNKMGPVSVAANADLRPIKGLAMVARAPSLSNSRLFMKVSGCDQVLAFIYRGIE